MSEAAKAHERLNRIVLGIHNRLKNSGAICRAFGDPHDYIHWADLEIEFDFDEIERPSIRLLADQLDKNWVSINAGLFIGMPGEQSREYAVSMSYMSTRASNMRDRLMTIGKNGKLKDLVEFSKGTAIDIHRLPDMLKALGSPLDPAASRVLKSG